MTLPDEILVVDDGGADETQRVCRRFEPVLPIQYIYNNVPGPSICSLAKNIGVRQARYSQIVTSEPELFFVTDVIAQFKTLWEQHPEDILVAGNVILAPPAYVPGPNDDWTNFERAVGWVPPYAAMWHKPWLEVVRGWDEDFPGPWGWEDIDLLWRLKMEGHREFCGLDITVLHQHHGGSLGDPDGVNERYWKEKERLLIDATKANKGHDWGVVV